MEWLLNTSVGIPAPAPAIMATSNLNHNFLSLGSLLLYNFINILFLITKLYIVVHEDPNYITHM